MNRILIPASFLAVAMPAAHSFLMTDTGIRSWGREQSKVAGFSTGEKPAPALVFTEPQASDDPAWYNNYE